MDATALEESLKVTRDWLNLWSDIATAGVVLGLILEYGVEFAEAIRKRRWKPLTPGPLRGHHVLPRIGAVLVVLGIAAELWMHMRLSQADDELLAIQRDKDRVQETTIAELNVKAKNLKADNLQLEKLIQPRSLTHDQRESLKAQALAFSAQLAVVQVEQRDLEAWRLADQIFKALSGARWNVDRPQIGTIGVRPIGIQITHTPDSQALRAAEMLRDQLRAAGIATELVPLAPAESFLRIDVGLKPLPVEGEG